MTGLDGSHSPEVLVLGIAAIDLIARVETLPRKDELVLAQSVTSMPGGAGANVATGLARLGHAVGFVGKLGDDENGRELLHAFKKEGIDTHAIKIEQGIPSATCFIVVDAGGERTIVAFGGAGQVERLDEVDLDFLRGARALCVTDLSGEIVTKVTESIHEAGGLVFYSPGGVAAAEGMSHLEPCLQGLDVLLMSCSEAYQLMSGLDPESAARVCLDAGVALVVLTLGAEGVMLATRKEVITQKAFAIGHIVDSTGAGDAFAAGLVAGYLEGKNWEKAARMGSAVAALKMRHEGARSGLPNRTELEAFLRQHSQGQP